MVERSRASTLSQKNRVSRKPTTAAAGSRHGKPASTAAARRKVNLDTYDSVSPEQRWRLITEVAHVRAGKRQFATGNPIMVHRDWLAALAEVDARLQRAGQVKKSAKPTKTTKATKASKATKKSVKKK